LLALVVVEGGLIIGFAQNGQGDFTGPVRDESQKTIDQLTLAIRIGLIAPDATSNLGDVKLNMARILNILVGPNDPLYQKNVDNPPGADGIGVIPHLNKIQNVLAPYANSNAQAQSLLHALPGIIFFTNSATDDLSAALKSQDDGIVRRTLHRLIAFLVAARGSRDDPLSEGGVRAINAQMPRSP
jgi:hypothetical protein